MMFWHLGCILQELVQQSSLFQQANRMLRPMQITAGQLERHPERWLDDMLDAGYTARTPEGVRPKPRRVQTCAEQSPL